MARVNQNFHNLPSHAHKPDNSLYVGTGIPATGFNTSIGDVDQFANGSGNPPVELGLKTHLRFGGDIPNTSVDSSGEINVNVPNGSFVGNPNLAKFNFALDVDQQPVEGRHANDLMEKPVHLLIDVNPGANVKYLDLLLVASADPVTGQPHNIFVAADDVFASFGIHAGDPIIVDNGEHIANANAINVDQNSENLGFFKSLWTDPTYHWQAGGHFDVALVQTESNDSVQYNTTTGNLIGIPADNALVHMEYNFV